MPHFMVRIKNIKGSAGFIFILVFLVIVLFFNLPKKVYPFNLTTYQTLSPRFFFYSYKEDLAPENDTDYGFFTGAGYRTGIDIYLTPNAGVYGSIGGDAEVGKLHYNGYIATNDNTLVYYYHTDGMINESDNIGIFGKKSGWTAKFYFGTALRYWIRSTGEYSDRITGSLGCGLALRYIFRKYAFSGDFMQSYIPVSPLNFVINRGQRFDMSDGNIKNISLSVRRKNLSLTLFYNILSISRSNYVLIGGNLWFEPSSVAKETGISLGYSF